MRPRGAGCARLAGEQVGVGAEVALETTDAGLSHYAQRLDPTPPRRFTDASVFIDSGGPIVIGGQVIDTLYND